MTGAQRRTGTKQMDEIGRIQSDISQLTRRVDDFSMRLAVVETQSKNFDEKLDMIRESIEKWNRIGFWLVTVVVGGLIAAILQFVVSGGLAPAARAMGF